MLELADETDSKSVVRKGVWVRVPPPAPRLDVLIDQCHKPSITGLFRIFEIFPKITIDKKLYNTLIFFCTFRALVKPVSPFVHRFQKNSCTFCSLVKKFRSLCQVSNKFVFLKFVNLREKGVTLC